MSDTPVEDTNEGSGDDGQFLGEDLAKLVTLLSDVRNLGGGKQLDDNEAQKIIVEQLTSGRDGDGTMQAWLDDSGQLQYRVTQREADIAELIVDALPPGMRNVEVLEALDLRPYLVALDGKSIVLRKNNIGLSGTDAATVDTSGYLQRYKAGLVKAAEELASSGTLPPREAQERIAAVETDPGMNVGVRPIQRAEVVGSLTGESAEWDPNATSSVPNGGFPIEDFRAMVNADMLTLTQMVDQQAQMAADGQQGYFPVDIGVGSRQRVDTTTMEGIEKASGARGISTLDAINYLTTLPPSQIETMQLKLAAAGYFDKIEGGSFYEKGNAHDPVTKAAWQMLLTDSIRTNQPTTTILVNNTKDYRKKVTESRLAGIQAIDPTYNNINADSYAQNLIGRNLTTEEHERLNQFVVQLRTDRAGYVQGAVDNPADRPLQGETGYTNTDVEQFVTGMTGHESAQRAQDQRFYKLSNRGN